LGSNLGDRAALLSEAIERLESAGVRVVHRSAIYETEPVEVVDQPWFLNLVLEIETSMNPQQLLDEAQKIERIMGRKHDVPKGPRTIDIDILTYADSVIDTPDLRLPHPGLARRRFVLEPLAEIAPALRHPVTRRTVREMLAATEPQVSRRLE